MKIREIAAVLEEWAPLQAAEDFDNTGLLVGDPDSEVSGILVTLDTLENVVEEAIDKKLNLIVSFHPIIFNGLKKITGQDYVARAVAKALKHGIGIYSMHTALDNVPSGVNYGLCRALGLVNTGVLIPKSGFIKKLSTYVPTKDTDRVRNALFNAGAGTIGKYSHCSFTATGRGSFMPEEGANPAVGEVGSVHFEEEDHLELTFPRSSESAVLKALFASHPYEEVAYEITTLDNKHQHLGMGMLGEFPEAMEEKAFLEHLKNILGTPVIRHSALPGKPVKKVAVLGGSGAFAIKPAIRAGADALVTADIKYHQFFETENKLVLADVGHFESEQFTKTLIADYLKKKIPNFAIALAESHTNPIYYY